MADDMKKDDAAQAAEEAAREVAKAGELAADALNKALTYFSPARRLGAALSRLGRVFTENGFRRLAGGMGLFGDGLFILVEALVVVLAIGAAIKQGDWVLAPLGFGLVGLLLAIQYIASRFLELNDSYIKLWPSRMGIPTLPGALAWLVAIGGLLYFLSTFEGLRAEPRGWEAFWLGFGAWVGANFLAWSFLHPGLANVAIERDTRGPAEALDILSYLAKLWLRLVSMIFGFAVLGGVVWLIMGMVELFKDGQLTTTTSAITFIIWIGFLPLLAYIGTLIVRYHISLGEAILSLLGKGEAKR